VIKVIFAPSFSKKKSFDFHLANLAQTKITNNFSTNGAFHARKKNQPIIKINYFSVRS